jgi:hypothetical protein
MKVSLYQSYSIDNKLHVSAIRWPSSGFEQVFEEKKLSYIFFGSEISDRRWNGVIKSIIVKS